MSSLRVRNAPNERADCMDLQTKTGGLVPALPATEGLQPADGSRPTASTSKGGQTAHTVRNGRLTKLQGNSAAGRKRVADGVKRGTNIGNFGRQQVADGGMEGAKGGDQSQLESEDSKSLPTRTIRTHRNPLTQLSLDHLSYQRFI